MSEFVKYQHIERLGTEETDGILDGLVYVFPKIDGTNASVWLDGVFLCCGSRNRKLSLDNDNQGFMKWVTEHENIIELLKNNPGIKLYGEWLVPHTLKTYQDDAWRKFYVFDVLNEDGYICYNDYKIMLDEYNVDYIPTICTVNMPTVERVTNQLEKSTFLIQDGFGAGEGVVLKNYDYKNKFGRVIWAKIVRNEFKTKHTVTMGAPEIKEKMVVESAIVNKYVTSDIVEKTFAKIKNDGGWSSKRIPQLLNTVFHDLITEDAWHFVKENKHPTINFRELLRYSNAKIRELKSELF